MRGVERLFGGARAAGVRESIPDGVDQVLFYLLNALDDDALPLAWKRRELPRDPRYTRLEVRKALMASARMTSKLVGGVVYSVSIFGVLLFLPAWTLHWWRAWALLGVVFAASATTMFGIFPSRPDLLDERYKPPVQVGQPLADKIVLQALMVSFFGLVVFIPIDVFRLHLLGGPGLLLATLGLVLFAAGWTVIALALRENAFAAPVVRHQEERRHIVVETGPYGFVRHPMYAGAIPLMVGMALWLGSYAGALFAVVPLTALALRVVAEERFLRRELPGYDAYTRRVRWRLVPRVW